MFGISFEPSEEKTNKEKEEEDLKKAIDLVSSSINDNMPDGFKKLTLFIIISILSLIFLTPFLFLFLLGLFSSFLWNNSLALFFDLPILEWFNFVFGYLFFYFVYKILKVMW